MKKLVYILWDDQPRAPIERRKLLLDRCAPALLERGARHLQVNVADERVDVASPAPRLPGARKPFVAQVNVWADADADYRTFEEVLRTAGFVSSCYRVDENVYTDYGENQHAPTRSWPDGERSPGVLAVTLLERPAQIPKDEWMRRWFGRQSPLSEAMQPRARYVRNIVLQPLTPGAVPYEGIVEEAWPSSEHVRNPFLFYGAKNPLELTRNMLSMLRSVSAFLPIWKIPNVMMSEYFVRSSYEP